MANCSYRSFETFETFDAGVSLTVTDGCVATLSETMQGDIARWLMSTKYRDDNLRLALEEALPAIAHILDGADHLAQLRRYAGALVDEPMYHFFLSSRF